MNTKEKIDYLQSICKESVLIFINSHYDNHETISEFVLDEQPDLEKEIIEEMTRLGVMYQVIAYPGTQVGSYRSIHYDLDAALEKVITGCKEYHKIP